MRVISVILLILSDRVTRIFVAFGGIIMNLSDNLQEVTLMDLKWSHDASYETDVKWLAMNIISILSNKDRLLQNKKEFKMLTGQSLYVPTSFPANNWSGSYQDVVTLTAVLSGKNTLVVINELNSLTFDEDKELSIRLRRFSGIRRNPLYGESSKLKKDDVGNYYLWAYDSTGKLVQVPEYHLKSQLLLWESVKYPLVK